tara:strand:- start:14353 stop:16017 length:1665 start_codon:yes stop_codon:yes gene_type:complete
MRKYADSVASSQTGLPIFEAEVRVYLAGTATLASLFADNGVTTLAQPVLTDGLGLFQFYVADGLYDLTYTFAGNTIPVPGIEIYDDAADRAVTARALLMPVGDAGYTLPVAAGRVSTVMSFDPAGAPSLIPLASFPSIGVSRTYLDQIGVVEGMGANAVTNTALINTALATGALLWGRPGALYKISQSLLMPSGSGLICEGDRAIIYMPAANFTNTAFDSVSRYASNAVAINFSGQKTGSYIPTSGVKILGFAIESDPAQGRNVNGITGQNVKNWEIDVECYNFPVGVAVRIASSQGSGVLHLNAHDFYDNTTSWGASPQSTGYEQDNDRINGVISTGVRVESPRVNSLRFGAALQAVYGYETDGINLVNGLGTLISAPDISFVGEGIDDFSNGLTLAGGSIRDVDLYGLKKAHGGRNGSHSGFSILRPGLAGIKLEGSNDIGNVAGHSFSGFTVSDADPTGAWFTAGATTFGISITGPGATYMPRRNAFSGGVVIQGANGQIGYGDTSSGPDNYGMGLNIIAGTAHHQRRVYITAGGGNVTLAGSNTAVTDLV